MTTPSNPPKWPTRPRLTLRVGFAGRRADSETDEAGLQATLEAPLKEVLSTLGHQLAALTPGVPVQSGTEPRVAAFFDRRCPLLRLVTGLCEGADAIAARALETVSVSPDAGEVCEPGTMCLETELAAVLPFDVDTYRRSRYGWSWPSFDQLLARCAWVLELDGIYDRPDAETLARLPKDEATTRAALAGHRRERGYRAQSAFLLRHSDLLIAAANPNDAGKAGGTLETVRAALAFDLPVVFIHTGRDRDNVYLIEPEADLSSVLFAPAPALESRRATLRGWVTRITTDPDSDLSHDAHGHDEARARAERLLKEYFERPDSPPRDAAGKRVASWRETFWSWFEQRFRSGPGPKSDPELYPYASYRRRATDLNYHYAGLYRGAFLLNYAFAICAVSLAALSLALLGTATHTGPGESVAAFVPPPTWLYPTLLALALMKLGLVGFIARNTQRANSEEWNDLAVNHRYLAERLRGMHYLPLAGSHQPPSAAPPQFASRAVRQSAVDWLFDSLVRAISPADLKEARTKEVAAHDGVGRLTIAKLLTLSPRTTAELVRDRWIREQVVYHDRNARTMSHIHHASEYASVFLSRLVIGIVSIDIGIVLAKVFYLVDDEWVPTLWTATVILVGITAVLPAVVAALGGIRFQSECQRLAERSAVMKVLLAGRTDHARHEEPTGFWQRLRTRCGGACRTTWVVVRHMAGRPPNPPPVVFAGGRHALAGTLVRQIEAATASPDTNPGSWSHDVLRMSERVASDFVQEAAEWSVLYAKEVSDPG